ncbi:MAG: hypothetical protein K2P51_01355 [Rhabdochlamydiaceae bacterium]|nr:hypothetical protein [Rhabdochlamydiaceae bacterium]
MNLILFGFKHCGKTTYGRKLAKQLVCPFIDTDLLLEQAYALKTNEPLTCRQMYQHLGEAAFRALETKTLETLCTVQNSIIAVGGGMVLNPLNVALLYQIGTLVHLILDDETLKNRTLTNELPAYLDQADKEGSFNQLVKERKAIYASIRAHPLLLKSKSDDEILAELKELANGK